MNSLFVAAAEPATVLHAQSLTQWLHLQLNSITGVLQGFGLVLGLVILFVQLVKGKFGISSIVVGGLTAALIVWLVFNIGRDDKPSELIDDQFNNNAAPAVMDHYTNADHTSAAHNVVLDHHA